MTIWVRGLAGTTIVQLEVLPGATIKDVKDALVAAGLLADGAHAMFLCGMGFRPLAPDAEVHGFFNDGATLHVQQPGLAGGVSLRHCARTTATTSSRPNWRHPPTHPSTPTHPTPPHPHPRPHRRATRPT